MNGTDEMAEFIRTARQLAAERKRKTRHRLRGSAAPMSLRGFGRVANSDVSELDGSSANERDSGVVVRISGRKKAA